MKLIGDGAVLSSNGVGAVINMCREYNGLVQVYTHISTSVYVYIYVDAYVDMYVDVYML